MSMLVPYEVGDGRVVVYEEGRHLSKGVVEVTFSTNGPGGFGGLSIAINSSDPQNVASAELTIAQALKLRNVLSIWLDPFLTLAAKKVGTTTDESQNETFDE